MDGAHPFAGVKLGAVFDCILLEKTKDKDTTLISVGLGRGCARPRAISAWRSPSSSKLVRSTALTWRGGRCGGVEGEAGCDLR